MSLSAIFTSLTAWLAALTGAAPQQDTVHRVVIQDTIILRVPVRPMRPRAAIEWIEHKGPKCLELDSIVAATLSSPSSIDFLLRDRSRVRARMDHDCPALDFWGGFYLQTKDDRVCVKREAISSRMGGSCRIDKFRSLEAQLKR